MSLWSISTVIFDKAVNWFAIKIKTNSLFVISSLTGLIDWAVVSLVANVFVNGIRYFEALRLDLL